MFYQQPTSKFETFAPLAGHTQRPYAPPGFTQRRTLLNLNIDCDLHKKLENLGIQQNIAINNELWARMLYPINQEPMVVNHSTTQHCWPHWNNNIPYDTQKLRALSPSLAPLSNREHNPALMKTKICDHWRRSGSCSYGDSCWYAHGEDDLRKVSVSRNHRMMDERIEDGGDQILTKNTVDEDNNRVLPKRISTNIKGLTVNIPPSIAFKDQATANNSMPLSPAQERWISMSIGAIEKNNESSVVSASSSTTMRNGMESELEKKFSIDNIFERRSATIGKFSRNDDIDDYGLLSPNPFPHPLHSTFSSGGQSQAGTMSSHHRSFNRISRVISSQPFAAMPCQQPIGQEQPRVPRPVQMNSNGFQLQSQTPIPNLRSSREIPQAPQSSDHHPQFQQAIWNVAGEIYQRQKDVETGGVRGVTSENSKTQQRDSELNRLVSKLKIKDVTYLRFLAERGLLNEREVSKQIWKENGSLYNQQSPIPSKFPPNSNVFPGNDQHMQECPCRSNRSNVAPSQQQSPHQFLQQQQQYILQSPQLRHQSYCGLDVLPPPKMFESLLPTEDNFSIWLDLKPKKENCGFRRSPEIEQSNSGASLLTKMEALRAQKCPISEEEMRSASGSAKSVSDGKHSGSSGDSSPAVLSLMELLSNENLLDEKDSKPKTTMFDFETGFDKIAEQFLTKRSIPTTASKNSGSPTYFFFDEKTPGYDDSSSKKSDIFTSSSTQSPSFMEQCDFFAAGGSCPFGDGCNLSHSPLKDRKHLQAL